MPAKPRNALARLVPTAVAEEALGRLVAHVAQVVEHLPAPRPRLRAPGKAHAGGPLYDLMHNLTVYAQTGAWEAGLLAGADLDAREVLYAAAHRRPVTESDLDPEDPVGLVLLAAGARLALAEDEPVTLKALGALAGVDPSVVGKALRAGRLEAAGEARGRRTGAPLRVTPASSRAWLAARGVPGPWGAAP